VLLPAVLDEPLIAGPLPTAIAVAGGVAGLVLLMGRTRRWWLRQVPLALLSGVVVAALTGLAVVVFQPFPDALPTRVLIWNGVFVAAVGLAWGHRDRRRWRQVIAAVAVLAVLATCVMKVNAFYGYRPTIAAALGLPAANQIDLGDLPAHPPVVHARPDRSLAATWHAPAGMPRTGKIASVTVPGRRSRFPARPAWLYLPPAYLAVPRARLPVLVMVPGQPGGPEDWLLAGRLVSVMDAFAAAHDGLAPVVIVPDTTGSNFGNTLCLDSRLGAAETYLADDVPGWLAANLDVDTSHLAIGGFSYGGTCALQLALRRPDVYRTFLDVSGQAAPTLGDLPRTVASAFGGDTKAYQQVDPLAELATRSYPGTGGVFVVGRNDDVYRPQAEHVAVAARQASIAVTLQEVPGVHTWGIATAALAGSLPWIAGRDGLLDPVPAPSTNRVEIPGGTRVPSG
jgi:S-formylglutathione hydrolase FrmB